MGSMSEQVHQLQELIFTVTTECVCVCVHVCDGAICHCVVLCLLTYKGSVAEGTDPTPPSYESLAVSGNSSAERTVGASLLAPLKDVSLYMLNCVLMSDSQVRCVENKAAMQRSTLNSWFSEEILTVGRSMT